MKVGFALRSSVFAPSLLPSLVPTLDDSGVDSVWFPSVGPFYDALDLCGISLGLSRRIRVGTGVIRPKDYPLEALLARVRTLNEASGGRFILGLGTGRAVGRTAIQELIRTAGKLRTSRWNGSRPPVFFAALRSGMLRAAFLNAEGAILNFCPPRFVAKILPSDLWSEKFTLGCYVKLFFAQDDRVASGMLADEFRAYDALPQYHAMFEEIGVSGSIENLGEGSTDGIPADLLEISTANPSDGQITAALAGFREAGVDLPIVYPYVTGDEGFKTAVVKRLASLVA